jgi:serpin B
MVVCLPDENYGVNKLIADLNEQSWQFYLQSLDKDTGIIQMPKFKLEYELTLNDVLKSMGMAIAFSGAADFSRISPGSDLFIYRVIHKSFVQTDEKGTEAAAVTAVEMRELSAGPQPKIFFMRMDHPFVFIIREKNTDAILFMGKVLNPNG